jgi:predicted transposase/invertase (TIGR01784 family)
MFAKFLDPKNDFAFKKIFGTERNKDILIHFLNDIVTRGVRPAIKHVTFLKTIQDPEVAIKKTSIVDILCEDESGTRYIVEMQVVKFKGFHKRAMYYAAKAYTSQMEKGEKYEDLKEVIFIAISDFTIFPKKKAYLSEHVVLDKHNHEHDLKDFSFTFLELPKFNKSINELKNMTDKWMYFFKHGTETSLDDMKKIVGDDIIFRQAYDELSHASFNEEEMNTYDQDQKRDRDYRAVLDQKFDDGIEQGVNKGIEIGEWNSKMEIARNMLSQNVDKAFISQCTGLSIEELEALWSQREETVLKEVGKSHN